MHTIWEEFLIIAREEVGTRVVETWFKAVAFKSWNAQDCTVHLEAPNRFVRDWIQQHYIPMLQRNLARLLHTNTIKVVLLDKTLAGEEPAMRVPTLVQAATRTTLSDPISNYQSSPKTSSPQMPSKTSAQRVWGALNPNYVFENFIVGPSNSLAYAASLAVADKPGVMYNPLFIYGGSGLGKTHLLHAIGNAIQKNNSRTKVLYQTTDRFVNEFIYAIRFDQMHKFQAKYKDIDILLVDDVQFISNKEQTQEAFFHIFNTLYESHKQIVFSSDVYPQNMQGIAERLRSRLAWGLVADIYVPPLETKIAILTKKAELHGFALPEEIASFIAGYDAPNVRELEGCLVRVMAYVSLTKQPLTIELVKKVLVRIQEPSKKTISAEAVLAQVARHYNITVDDLISKNRNKYISQARQVAMFLVKKLTMISLRDMGDFFGKRDHSTVMHALEKIEKICNKDHEFSTKLKKLEHDVIHH